MVSEIGRPGGCKGEQEANEKIEDRYGYKGIEVALAW